jgi:putative transposase
MRFRKSAHATYKTEYHLVWIPRYRRKIFVKGVKEYAEKILLHIFELDPDIEVIKVNVQEESVHMVIVIPPRIAVANAIQFIKTKSAKVLKAKFSFIQKTYARKSGIWSRGYCVSCIGMDEKEILAYVEHQEKEDKGQLQLVLQ